MNEANEVFKAWLGDKCAKCMVDFTDTRRVPELSFMELERIPSIEDIEVCAACATTEELLEYVKPSINPHLLDNILVDLQYFHVLGREVPPLPPLSHLKTRFQNDNSIRRYREIYGKKPNFNE